LLLDKNNVVKPLIRKVDCLRLYVPDLETGLAFYRDRLGHELIWRSPTVTGLRMPKTDAELVIQTEEQRQEVDLLVDSADEAAPFIEGACGKVIVPPFDIQNGRCVLVEDPWGNPLVLLDISKGLFATDADGNIIRNVEP
jgi:catechol 2,3-dioxygenase-like lactoylglutathione lyase family enzyme